MRAATAGNCGRRSRGRRWIAEPAATWTLTREGSCRKALAEQLKNISGAIQETVQQLLQITSTGIVLSGRARVFLDNASLTRMALQEAAAGMERADDLPRVKLADESIVPRAYALAKVLS